VERFSQQEISPMIELKTEREIGIMKDNGKILAQTLQLIGENIHPGTQTKELDRLAEEFIKSEGAYPAFKGYRGFPSSICVSINEEVVHGIPGEREIQEGQIVSVDIGVFKDGYYADAACTYPVGEISFEAQKLIQITQKALESAFGFAKEGRHLSDLSHAIQTLVEDNGFSVVRDLVGHGIGRSLHEEPQIPCFTRGRRQDSPIIPQGAVLAIEVMYAQGKPDIKLADDRWTIQTRDGTISALYEETVIATKKGPIIVTR